MSGTVFDSHKMSLQDLVAAALMWMNSSAGQPALELRRRARRSYNTVFVLQQKLREALQLGYNLGLLNGEIEVDGSHPKAGLRDPDFGATLPADRRFVMVVRKRSGTRGSGAVATRVAIVRRFREHCIVEHSSAMVDPKGEHNNLAEELNFRLDRAERGMYLNLEPKYLYDYAVEVAFLPTLVGCRIASS